VAAALTIAGFMTPDDYIFGTLKQKNHLKVKGGKVPEFGFLSAAESLTLNKIKYNMPVINQNSHRYIDLLIKSGFNIALPFYKIEINEHKNLKALQKELAVLRRLEDLNFVCNIVISFKNNPYFTYYDIKLAIAKCNFVRGSLHLMQTEFLNKELMFAINNFDINKPVGTKISYFDTKNDAYWLDYGKNKLSLGREYYEYFSCTSSNSNADIIFAKDRAVSFKHNFEVERICINNISFKFQKIVFNSFYNFNCGSNENLLMGAAPEGFSLKITDAQSSKNFYINSSLNMYKNNTVTKQGVLARRTLKLKPGSSMYIYVVKSEQSFKPLKNIIEGEEVFNAARSEYKDLIHLKIASSNAKLNRLINELMPQRILTNYISKPEVYQKDFFAFLNLQPFTNPSCSPDGVGEAHTYFNLLYRYAGISFLKNGIILNLNKRDILDEVQITFMHENIPVNLIIKNKKANINGFIYNGVEYTGIRFLPFEEIVKNNKLVLEL